jgi:hypothetical protein
MHQLLLWARVGSGNFSVTLNGILCMLAYNHTKILISLWKFEEIILHQKEVGGKGNI